ncbi:MAG: nucleotide exchange factor GrpE [Pseudomonadota bacterium]
MNESNGNRPKTDGSQDNDPHVTISDEAVQAEAAQADGASADGAHATESEISPEDALAAAEARATEHWDKYLRAVAELDNVRKRARKDVENARNFGIEKFATELLAVNDSLEAAISNGGEASAETLLEGSQATLRLLVTSLQKFGVAEVEPTGAPFDPQLHEAMTMVPSPDAEPNTVIDTIQKGYTLNGRLIRPARVIVAAAPA